MVTAKLQPGQWQERKPTDGIGHLVPAEVEVRGVGMDHGCGAVKRTNLFVVTDIWKRKEKRQLKSEGSVSFLNKSFLLPRTQRDLLCQSDTKLVKKKNIQISVHFVNSGRLTVVTQQQACLPVFIHVDGCYKSYLQAKMKVRK